MSDDRTIRLCCLLWAVEGEAAGLHGYEDAVLPLVAEHRGAVTSRVLGGAPTARRTRSRSSSSPIGRPWTPSSAIPGARSSRPSETGWSPGRSSSRCASPVLTGAPPSLTG
ncbi:hypothetical protein [Pseudolysinimonas kribbensis]|uniref:hypothetical protein n=1 Tax=Pseudolysinimonas kribbensis TaxID=433641 RepID=UPI0024E1610C|nr:hypothetical protein [Pseudolysinimonas kribbensis]